MTYFFHCAGYFMEFLGVFVNTAREVLSCEGEVSLVRSLKSHFTSGGFFPTLRMTLTDKKWVRIIGTEHTICSFLFEDVFYKHILHSDFF